jgi:hypothetical protein
VAKSKNGNLPKEPRLTRTWVRTLIALTASLAVGLAPFLGTMKVPLFTPLLSVIPTQLQGEAIAISSAAMTLVAIYVQWLGKTGIAQRRLAILFRRVGLCAIVALVGLILVSNRLVVRVPYLGGQHTATFLKGIRRPKPDICAGISIESCIAYPLTFNDARITDYWGDGQMYLARVIFLLAYTTCLCLFAGLLGLLVLRLDSKSGSRSKRGQKIRTQRRVPL